ncbi:hypothetical protein GCM10010464_53770 [Pseudonocardia yunnanensis]
MGEFAAVTAEIGQVLDADQANMTRFGRVSRTVHALADVANGAEGGRSVGPANRACVCSVRTGSR